MTPYPFSNFSFLQSIRHQEFLERFQYEAAPYPDVVNLLLGTGTPSSTSTSSSSTLRVAVARLSLAVRKESIGALLLHLNLSTPHDFQVGLTKVYFKGGVMEQLELRRKAMESSQAIVLQAAYRCSCARRAFAYARECAIAVQSVVRMWLGSLRCVSG
jgi:myosin-5